MTHHFHYTKRTIFPAKAVKILKEHGTEITIQEAEIILNLMYKFAKLSIIQAIEKDLGHKSNSKKTPSKLFK